MLYVKQIFFLLFLCIASSKAFSQLQIVPQTVAQNLAQKLVGDGITISNVTMTASPLSTGFFYNQAGTQISLDSGIVLSTGRVLTSGTNFGINGPQGNLATNNLNTAGDVQLTTLVNGQATHDATILEFDFVPIGDSVRFRYVFSSDEYPQFTCSNFNDVFAFFISGPGIAGAKNMALVPGTNIPVAINSVNSGTPGSSYNIGTCNAMGAGSPFTQYYVNNTGNPFFSHNGHTTVLIAKSSVQPCQTYHLKIAIADVFDFAYDSGVFLEAKSLTSDPIQLIGSTPVSNGLAYLVEGCQSGGVKIVRSKKSPTSQPINLTFGGTAINGTDVQLIPPIATIPANDSLVFVPIIPIVDNLPEGTEVLKIYVSNGCVASGLFLDSIEIQIREYDTLAVSPHDSVGLCKNGTLQLTATSTYASYQWFPSSGLTNSTIYNPVASPGSGTTNYVCTAITGDCHARDSVRIKIKDLEFVSKKEVNCKNGITGEIKVSGGWEWKQPVQYNVDNGAYGPDSTFLNLPAGIHVVRIKDASNCIDSLLVTVTQAFPDLVLADSVVTASCSGVNGQVILTGTGGNAPYSYSFDALGYTNAINYPANFGPHTINIKDANGCVTSRSIVVGKDSAITFNVTASAASCSGGADGVVTAHATGGSGTYLYSIDGVTFQSVDSFLVSVGSFTFTVKDNKGCTASLPVNIPLNQTVFINVGNDTTICEGDSVHFHTTATGASYSWTPNSTLSSLTIPDPVAFPVNNTTYYVSAVNGICSYKDTISINVNKAPVPDAGLDSSICYGKTINLNGSGGIIYSWTPASLVSDPTIASPSIKPLNKTTYYLKVRDANGCWSLTRDSVKITLVPAVKAFAGRDTVVAINQQLQLIGRDLGASGVTIYNWSPSYGLNNPDIANPIAVLDKDMTYRLTLTTPEGCEGTDDIFIKAYQGPEIYVPSGFTPNGDGKNDVLRVIPVGMKEFHYFKVFNRWGQMVFASANEKFGWDGTINGLKQTTATYIWMAEMVDFKGNVVWRKGVTTLIR
jgi:gliding motility-associated-like protein